MVGGDERQVGPGQGLVVLVGRPDGGSGDRTASFQLAPGVSTGKAAEVVEGRLRADLEAQGLRVFPWYDPKD